MAPGPRPAGGVEPGEGEDVSALLGDWKIFQRARGHRWSLDDLLTAWFCTEVVTGPVHRHIDLGCGIGSVLLSVAWLWPEAHSIGVEAQAISAALARKSIAYNGCSSRVVVYEGDLRDTHHGQAQLVTGTPPYFPLGTGTLSPAEQAPFCRFEHRGGPEDYSAAAARLLEPDGWFVLCASVLQRERVASGLAAAGLHPWQQLEVVGKEGKAPLIDLYAARLSSGAPVVLRRLTVRDRAGQWTEPMQRVRERMGLPPIRQALPER